LEKDDIRRGYAAYWLSYELDFESDGSLRYTPIPTDTMRNSAYLRTVDSVPRPAWIVCQPGDVATCAHTTGTVAVNPLGLTWASLVSWLHSQGIPYRSTMIDGFTVVVPGARITPAALEHAGILPL